MIFKNKLKIKIESSISSILAISLFIYLIFIDELPISIGLVVILFFMILILDSFLYKIIIEDDFIEEYSYFRKRILDIDKIGSIYVVQIKTNHNVLIVEMNDANKNFAEIYIRQIKNGNLLVKELSKYIKNEDNNNTHDINGYQNINGKKLANTAVVLFIFAILLSLISF